MIGIGVKYELPVVKDYGGFLHLLAAVVFRLYEVQTIKQVITIRALVIVLEVLSGTVI